MESIIQQLVELAQLPAWTARLLAQAARPCKIARGMMSTILSTSLSYISRLRRVLIETLVTIQPPPFSIH